MPYDPTKPAFGSPDSSAEMRAQLAGLKDIIDAIPAGPEGPPGVQGPPFASAVVDGVSTLNPGDAATVGATFDGTNVRFTFGIPRGSDGPAGPQGTQGTQGNDGPQGPTGEVSNAALTAAIAGTSSNTNAIPTLDTPFADPDAEAVRQAFNALVLALRR